MLALVSRACACDRSHLRGRLLFGCVMQCSADFLLRVSDLCAVLFLLRVVCESRRAVHCLSSACRCCCCLFIVLVFSVCSLLLC